MSSKQHTAQPRWSVYLIRGKRRRWIGSVRAADDEAAKEVAATELDIAEQDRFRIMVVRE